MGAGQSAEPGVAASTESKTCYYEVLGVERTATDEEIKKAYKRKALEWHPDRNYGDTENATRKFAEVQAAYDVLSDPQERAWYDSHRETILRGEEAGDDVPSHHYNIRMTTTDEIVSLIGRFNTRIPFTDDKTGFFGVLRETFGKLADEEAAACQWEGQEPAEYPSFGGKADDYEIVARPFYNIWSSFSTKKSFSWKEKYRLTDAPDRRIRRLMEKENRKCRDDAVREFNDAVRSLVAFVRKRDPRYIPNKQSESERQKILRDAAAAQAARSRAQNQERLAGFTVADWVKSRDDEAEHGAEFSFSEGDESVVEHIECVVCNKTFKSEKQYEAHEKSKKHVKAVQQLQRQMKRENMELDLNGSTDQVTPAHGDASQKSSDEAMLSGEGTKRENRIQKAATVVSSKSELPRKAAARNGDSNADESDEYAPRETVQERLSGRAKGRGSFSSQGSEATSALTEEASQISIDNSTPAKKIGKARAKREKKAAREAAASQNADPYRCAFCQEVFPSKTKLFSHIKDMGHATPVLQASRAVAKGRT